MKVFPPKVFEPLRIVYIGDVKRNNSHNNAGDSNTYLLTLANRNDTIFVASSKVAKASTISVAVAGVIAGIIALTFANVNYPLSGIDAGGKTVDIDTGILKSSDDLFQLKSCHWAFKVC